MLLLSMIISSLKQDTSFTCGDMYFIQNMIFIVIAVNNKNTGKINRTNK